MPEISALQHWISAEYEDERKQSHNPDVPWWMLALGLFTVMSLPFLYGGSLIAVLPLAALIVGVIYLVVKYTRNKKRIQAALDEGTLEGTVDAYYPFVIKMLVEYWAEDRLLEALGSRQEVVLKATWDFERLDAATDLPFWSSEETSEDITLIRDGMLDAAAECLRRLLVLSLTPPARFEITQEKSDEIIRKSSGLIAEFADRSEKLAARNQGTELDSSAYLNDLKALEAAKKEIDDLVNPLQLSQT